MPRSAAPQKNAANAPATVEAEAAASPPGPPPLPAPNMLELGILRDWVSYTRISITRLRNAGSVYAEPLTDFASVVEGVVNPDGAA